MLGRGTAHSLIRSASAGLHYRSSLQTRGHVFSLSLCLFKHKGNPPCCCCVGHSVRTYEKRKLDQKGRLVSEVASWGWVVSITQPSPWLPHSVVRKELQCGHPLLISAQKACLTQHTLVKRHFQRDVKSTMHLLKNVRNYRPPCGHPRCLQMC